MNASARFRVTVFQFFFEGNDANQESRVRLCGLSDLRPKQFSLSGLDGHRS